MERWTLLRKMAVLMLVICAAICSCRKETRSSSRTGTGYDFSYSGALCVGDTISFVSTAPAGSTYLWDFGDSVTSIAATPYHIYSRPDTFTVSLTIDGNTTYTMRKTVAVKIGSSYAYLIVGMRTWHRTVYHANWQGRDTTFIYPDTAFSVNFIDPATVTFGADTLHYVYSAPDTVLGFYYYPMCGCSTSELFFYPSSNRLKYIYSGRGYGNDEIQDTYTSGY